MHSCGPHDGRGPVGVGAAELVADRLQLTLLELADLDPPPAIRGPDDGGVHQLQDRPLAESVRDDLRPPAFFEEEALGKRVSTARISPGAPRRLEVLEELHRGKRHASNLYGRPREPAMVDSMCWATNPRCYCNPRRCFKPIVSVALFRCLRRRYERTGPKSARPHVANSLIRARFRARESVGRLSSPDVTVEKLHSRLQTTTGGDSVAPCGLNYLNGCGGRI